MSSIVEIEKLFRYDYGGEPKFERMVKKGSKLYKVLSSEGNNDILSNLKQRYPTKKLRKKRRTQKKRSKKKSIRNKSLKKTN